MTSDALHGRAHDLAVIDAFVEGGGSLFLRGDVGVGKSAVLWAGAARATGRGVRVVRAVAARCEDDLRFAGLHQLLRPLLAGLGDLPGQHRSVLLAALGLDAGPAPGGDEVVAATTALLRHAARDRPLLLAIDDLPWLDRDSSAVLRALDLAGGPIGLLAVVRDGDSGYEVAPLDEDAAATVLLDRFPDLAAVVRRRVLAEARGNPLALVELPAALDDAQRSGATPLPPVLPLTRRLRAAFGPMVEALSSGARHDLLVAALDDAVSDSVNPLVCLAVVDRATGAEQRRVHAALARRPGIAEQRRAWHLAQSTIGPDDHVAGLLDRLARWMREHGDGPGAVATFTRAAALSRSPVDRRSRGAFAAYLDAAVTGGLLDVPRRLEALGPGDGCLAMALATAYHLLYSGNGDVDSAHRLLRAAVGEATGPSDVLDEARLILVRINVFGGRSDFRDSDFCPELEQGPVTLAIHAADRLGRHHFDAGDWDRAARVAEDGRKLSERYGYRLLTQLFVHRQGLLAASRGDSETATRCADDLTRFAAPRRLQLLLTLAAEIRARDALGRGECEEAFLHATAGVRPGQALALTLMSDLVEAAVRSGRRTEALAHVEALRRAGAASGRLALVARGAAAIAAGDDRFVAEFDQALEVPGAGEWPFDLARIRLFYGERLRRGKATQAAREQLGAALATFTRLAAVPWAERARTELRASGAAGLTAYGMLSPQQHEIARLAATGMTNRQIGERLHLSPRTVGTHLYQIFPKLRITSRAALRDALLLLLPGA